MIVFLRAILIVVLIIELIFIPYTQQCQDVSSDLATTQDWWETAQFYQIYPRSFMDSDGDGIGDLKGITAKLQYLKDIGVTAAWLSPIFTSPMVDFGYDISDFYDIQPEYGTLDDFRELIKKANDLGLKIILDFVPNHASTENEWFKKSVKREKGYEDYFVWANAKYNENGERQPPSNWLSFFRGSAWAWNEERQQYYYHVFAVQQADLNYRNPAVVEQMKRVLRFWLDLGVAGFRIDAVPSLFEAEPDANGIYTDEGLTGNTDDSEDRNYLNNDLVENLPEAIDMVYQWHQVMADYKRIHGGDTRVLLIETYAAPSYTMLFYGNQTFEGAELPFNFNLLIQLKDVAISAARIEKAISDWMTNMPAGRVANWVIGNHDNRRAASRYGLRNIDAMNMLVMMLPGASVTYQGEELGMTDGYISWQETVDTSACSAGEENYEKVTRDPCRTPFQWSAQHNAGFSTGASTWLPLAADYETVNVEAENAALKSHLKIYKAMVALRAASKTLQQGSYRYKAINENVFVLKRYLAAEETLIYVANVGEGSYSVNLVSSFDVTLPVSMSVKVSSLDSKRSQGETLAINTLELAPGEAIVMGSN